ncbi:MAG TPA: Gfo/Idh/MocA family oxidoreductase [Chthoniobacter sp.]|nr:Gfo/Idh/MocA family oxidoreductase [Chthoniobacter sp.]
MNTLPFSRRRFVQTVSAAGFSTLGMPAILRSQSPGKKLNLVIIGCGGRGGANLKEMLDENIVALCDVNAKNLELATAKAPGAKKFRDFRKMYDELKDSEFDAVVVSTTEHTHAFATLPALQRKKHVYCEKPLTRDVHEARIITEAARAAGVATQMGTQIHAGANYRRVVELIQGGAIGPVHEAHVWVNRTWGRQSPEDAEKYKDIVSVQERPTEEMPVPPELDWDLWLGPAPARPFNTVYFPGPRWYRWWDFGNGTMSDLGSHWNDLPFWALNLDAPLTIEASGPPPHAEIAPATMSATYTYGARGSMPPVKLTWYQGQMKPPQWTEKVIPQWNDGVLFVGAKGMLLSDYSKHILLPEKDFAGFTPPAPTIPDSLGHQKEWLHACKTGAPTTCHFGYSGRLTEANHLGNVAYRAAKKLEWDTKNLRIPNAPEAEHFLRREYRAGWKLA